MKQMSGNHLQTGLGATLGLGLATLLHTGPLAPANPGLGQPRPLLIAAGDGVPRTLLAPDPARHQLLYLVGQLGRVDPLQADPILQDPHGGGGVVRHAQTGQRIYQQHVLHLLCDKPCLDCPPQVVQFLELPSSLLLPHLLCSGVLGAAV